MAYLMCKKCKSYYELKPGETPKDFSSECECGSKLKFNKNFNINKNEWVEFLIEGVCPICERENPTEAIYCAWCGKKIKSQL
ncbi:MAG: hypothetical protein PHY59_09695 [Methanobacterium sp.]|nr:hypothetical protein [Methanobacterium sp.]